MDKIKEKKLINEYYEREIKKAAKKDKIIKKTSIFIILFMLCIIICSILLKIRLF